MYFPHPTEMKYFLGDCFFWRPPLAGIRRKKKLMPPTQRSLYIGSATVIANTKVCFKGVVSTKRLRSTRLCPSDLASFKLSKQESPRDGTLRRFLAEVATLANCVPYDDLRIVTCDMLGLLGSDAHGRHNIKNKKEVVCLLDLFDVVDADALDADDRLVLGLGLHALREHARFHVWHGGFYQRALTDREFARQACALERLRSGRQKRHEDLMKATRPHQEARQLRFALQILERTPLLCEEMPTVDAPIERWCHFLKRASLSWGKLALSQHGLDPENLRSLQDDYAAQLRSLPVSTARPTGLLRLFFHTGDLVSHEPWYFVRSVAAAYGATCFYDVFLLDDIDVYAHTERQIAELFVDNVDDAIAAFCAANPDAIRRRGTGITLADERADERAEALIAEEVNEQRRLDEKRLRRREKKKRLKELRRKAVEAYADVVGTEDAAEAAPLEETSEREEEMEVSQVQTEEAEMPRAHASNEMPSATYVEEEVCGSIVAECDSDADVDLSEFDWQEWYDAAPLFLGGDGLCRSMDAMFVDAPTPDGPSVC